MRPSIVFFAGLTCALSAAANADTFYVNGTCGNDAWTGTSSVCSAPNGPKQTIQAGIDASVTGDTVIIADGVYTGAGNRDIVFRGRPITVRSENGAENCIIDCQADESDPHRGFLFESAETRDAIIDGLTIMNGFAPDSRPANESGGAIAVASGRLIVNNCTFRRNSAWYAGAIFCSRGTSVVIRGSHFDENVMAGGTYDARSGGGGIASLADELLVIDCTFTGNGGWAGGAIDLSGMNDVVQNCNFVNNFAAGGGAIFCGINATATISDCRIERNQAIFETGGGIWVYKTNTVTISRCLIIDNFIWSEAWGGGGGIGCFESSPWIDDCEIVSNTSGNAGGGMYNYLSGRPTLINCTFRGNNAPVGGGLYNWAGSPIVTNCILWNNSPNEIVDVAGALTTVNFSDVRGGWAGKGNIDANPRFGDPPGRLAPGSPCIDGGDPAMQPPGGRDLDGNMRVWNGRVDMGAYEFGSHPFGDIDCDGAIDALDIEPFLVALFEPKSYATQYPDCDINLADINGDGSIDALDIERFLNLLFP